MERRQFLVLSLSPLLLSMVKANPSLRRTGLVLDEGFLAHHISPAHPESPARYQAITSQLFEQDIFAKTTQIIPIQDVESWMRLVHSQQHIESIKASAPQTHQHALLATGGVLAAIDAVLSNKVNNAFCASRPPGHHALNTGQEEGFCYYNHIAIAARYAQQQYGINKVLIVDWDYHHGNGTEWAFYSDPTVLYFSTHDVFAYPGTGFENRTGKDAGQGLNINVHLDCGAEDGDIITAFEQHLLPAANKFKPDLILISAGFDSREDDLLGCHNITDDGFKQLTQIVMRLANQHCGGKIVSLLEGGYNIAGNAKAVVAHISTLMR